jgi:phosphoenolpyruvate carboxykinase (ATP)
MERGTGKSYDIGLEKRNELVKLAEKHLGYDSLYIWNVTINGTILQLRTNDSKFDDFWKENWFPAAYDHNLSPHGIIYALTGIPNTKPRVYYNSESKTGFSFNVDSYDGVKSLAIGIVMDIAQKQKNIHFLSGALVDVDGEGVALLGSKTSAKLAHTFLLLELDKVRVHSNDLVYVEQLGGESGRLSTQVSERKFYIKNDVLKVSPGLNELRRKSKKDDSHFMLDPFWIGGYDKFVNTTRIKVLFLLHDSTKDNALDKKLSADEALAMLSDSSNSFFNPNLLVLSGEEKSLQVSFFRDLLKFAACYSINTAKPLFKVQKRMREIVLNREYLRAPSGAPEITEPGKAIELQVEAAKSIISELEHKLNVLYPTPVQLRQMAEQYGTRTKFGNYNFVSSVKNRSAGLTVYVGSPEVMQPVLNPKQTEILKNLPGTMKELREYIDKAPFVSTKRTMGDNPHFTPNCTLYVSTQRKEMVRLAYMICQTLFEPGKGTGPDEKIIYIPEWQEKDRQILVFPEIGVTFVLGTDYYGEAKKGFLRMAMWYAKQRGMLGLHAGAKIVKARDTRTGKIKKYSMLLFGLTATGKTTHTCHDHGLNGEGEGIEIAQDDVVFLRPDLSVLGTERGFYLKTEGVSLDIQPLIYGAVTKPDAIFENVMVDYLGNVYFSDETLTGNGRGIMQRDDFGSFKAKSVNLPPVSELDGIIVIFITRRNTVVPIASKLTFEQAAAAFMLGESIETSGSDPKRAGESVREVGMNPFIVGSETEEGNRLYEMIKKYPDQTQCYLLNTGGVGELVEKNEDGTKTVKRKVLRVAIDEMAAIIRGIARGSIEWQPEPHFGTMVPKKVEGADMSKFDLSNFYSKEEIEKYVAELKRERVAWLEKFSELDPAIVNAFKS